MVVDAQRGETRIFGSLGFCCKYSEDLLSLDEAVSLWLSEDAIESWLNIEKSGKREHSYMCADVAMEEETGSVNRFV